MPASPPRNRWPPFLALPNCVTNRRLKVSSSLPRTAFFQLSSIVAIVVVRLTMAIICVYTVASRSFSMRNRSVVGRNFCFLSAKLILCILSIFFHSEEKSRWNDKFWNSSSFKKQVRSFDVSWFRWVSIFKEMQISAICICTVWVRFGLGSIKRKYSKLHVTETNWHLPRPRI